MDYLFKDALEYLKMMLGNNNFKALCYKILNRNLSLSKVHLGVNDVFLIYFYILYHPLGERVSINYELNKDYLYNHKTFNKTC